MADFSRNILQHLALVISLGVIVQIVYWRYPPHRRRAALLVGIATGTVSALAMLTPIQYAPGIFYDGRSVVLAVGSFIGGTPAAVVAALIAGAMRFSLGGAGVWAGLGSIAVSAAGGAIFHRAHRRQPRLASPPALWGFGLVVHLLVLACQLVFLPAEAGWTVLRRITIPFLVFYPLATLVLARLLLLVTEHRANESRYRTTLASLGEAVITTDAGGRVTFLNPPAETLTGWTARDAGGRPLAEVFQIVDDATGHPVESPLGRVLQEGVVTSLADRACLRHRDGSRRPIADSAAPIRGERGEVSGMALVFRDQTAERDARQNLERRIAEREALLRASQSLAAASDLSAVLQTIVDEAARLAQASPAKILRFDSETRSLTAGAMTGRTAWPATGQIPVSQAGLSGIVAETGAVVFSADVQTDPRNPYREADRGLGLVGYLGLPVRAGERLLGVLSFNTTAPHNFEPSEVALLQAFADQAAAAILQAEALEAARARSLQLEAIREIGIEIALQRELDRLFSLIMDRTLVLLQADSGTLFEWDPDRGELVPRANRGLGDWVMEVCLRAGEGLAGQVLETGRGIVVSEYARAVTLPPAILARRRDELAALRAAIAEPLRLGDRLVGVLVIRSNDPHRMFTASDQALLGLLAGQAAVAIENARLLAQATQRQTELSALLAATRALVGKIGTTRTLSAILEAADALYPGAVHQIWQWKAADQALHLVAVKGLRGASRLWRRRLPRGEGFVGCAMAAGEILTSADVRTDERFVNRELVVAEELVAAAAVPIIAADREHGAFCILLRHPHAFGAAELALLRSLADSMAAALENARLHAELQASVEELRRTQEELIRSEQLRGLGQMAAGIAHDLNNALAAILGQIELLKLQDPGGPVRDALDALETAATDGAATVRRLVDFARPKGSSPLVPCDLTRLVQEACEIARPHWKDAPERRGVRVHVDIALPADLPGILGNPPELREALTNLVFNAVDAMPAGGLLTFSGSADDRAVTLRVTDTGVGMSPEVQARIFEPFFTTKGPRGSGLGLAVVYGIVTRHHGRIAVESVLGRGTTFTLTFLRAPDDLTPAAPTIDRTPGASRRLLVVDDESAVRQTLCALLRAVGHHVWEAADGPAALAVLAERPVDAVLTDLGMPDMTGHELTRRIKRAYPACPVILLTGWHGAVDEASDDARADAVLEKPVHLNALLQVLRSVLKTP